MSVSLFVLLALASPNQTSAAALAPITAAEWDLEAARHLLDRAGFGGSPREVQRLHGLGPEQAVESLLVPPQQRDPHGRFEPAPFRTEYGAFRKQEASAEEQQRWRRTLRREDSLQARDYRDFWLQRMISGGGTREKMALFWHGYFTSSQREVRDSYLMVRQIELYRSQGLTSFRELLHAASREPAMLSYLDSRKNRKAQPNENFAREVMELFTMGPGHYTETDIHEAARAFTGWSFDRSGRFRELKRVHDDGEKQYLGRTGRFDGNDILEILLEQEATARFLAHKLAAFFVVPDPEPVLVEALAAELRKNDYALTPSLKTLFLSREFFDQHSRGALFKSPVEFVVSTLRRLEIEPPPGPFLNLACEELGQSLLFPPNVKGWEGHQSWINSATILLRANLAEVFTRGVSRELTSALSEKTGSGRPAFAKSIRGLRNWNPELNVRKLTGDARRADTVIQALCDRLLPIAPPPGTLDELRRYLAPHGDDGFRLEERGTRALVQDVVRVILSLPEYQLN